jgi:hypothetical protein
MARLILLVLAAVLSLDCWASKKQESVALQVARAGGLKNLRDVSQAELAKAYKDNKMTGGYFAAEAAAVGTGVFKPIPGVSSGTQAGSLLLLSFLLSNQQGAEEYPKIFAWMPKSDAANPNEAMLRFRAVLADAYSKALPDGAATVTTEILQAQNGLIFGGGTHDKEHAYLTIHTADCDAQTNGTGCYAYFLGMEREPKVGKSPEVLGAYSAYAWELSSERATFFGYPMMLRRDGKNLSHEMDSEKRVEVLRNISANLPPWIYIYLAPMKSLLQYPALLNQGEFLYFIEPERKQ